MLDEPLVRELVEEALESGATPEDVCRERVDLLPRVRERWMQARDMEAELDALFPPRDETPDRIARAMRKPAAELPRIPGHEVESVLGHGGMGVVYRARHERLHRTVAIKMLLAGEYASPRELARFLQEAESIASLHHHNIVQVHEVGELDGRPYFTMEFVEGGTLAQRLAGTPQPAASTVTALITLAEAVAVAHEGGIIHRDLKPSNVLRASDGTLKITDFGLARRVDAGASMTMSGTVLGTPSYMAPEQVQGSAHAIGKAADIYALGAILYEMLTGRPPFRAESALATQLQVVTQEPVPPSRLNAKVPRDLEIICLKCLHKSPERRYADASALAEDLRRFQRGEPISARAVGPFERAVKWTRRHPARTMLAAGIVITCVTVLATLISSRARESAILQSVEDDLREVSDRESHADWPGARTAVARARTRLGDAGPADLRARVADAERELDLVKVLSDTRLARSEMTDNIRVDIGLSDKGYLAAFRDRGVGTVGDDPALVAARISKSGVRSALLDALDDWAVVAQGDERRNWILDVARRVDPDPVWRDRARDPKLWDDLKALTEFVRTVPVDNQFTALLVALSEQIAQNEGDPADFLQRVHSSHTDDFWVNYNLGKSLLEKHDPESIDYFRSALALRPDTVSVTISLGQALSEQNRNEDAIPYLRHLVEIRPDSAVAHSELGIVLRKADHVDEARPEFEKALKLDPSYAVPHVMLGLIAMIDGDLDSAVEHTQRAVELAPDPSIIRNSARGQLKGIEALVAANKRLPGLLDGSDLDAKADVYARCAWICDNRKKYADAVRLYVTAFERDPQLAPRTRFHAAVTAVRGSAIESTSAEERRRLRAQALTWLRAEIDGWSKALTSRKASVRSGVRTEMRQWQMEKDLAPVHEPSALQRLDADEREQWNTLWNDVAGLADRAREPDAK